MFKGIFLKHAENQSVLSAPSLQEKLRDRPDVDDKPVLKLALAGFDILQRLQVKRMVRQLPQATAIWRVSDLASADALFVCGTNTQLRKALTTETLDDIQVLPGSTTEQLMVLSLKSMYRPIAFSLPVADPDIEPGFSFDVDSHASVKSVLESFEKCLRPKLAEFAIGKQLVLRELDLKKTVYHVMHLGKLLAVVDLKHFQIGLSPDADPKDVERAVWTKRPTSANAIPQHFSVTDVAEIRWSYVMHSQRDLLPKRYRHKPIYYRQPPKVLQAWLNDSKLSILLELKSNPLDFGQLIERQGVRLEELAHDLSCLYSAASITTTASKAATAPGRSQIERSKIRFTSATPRMDRRRNAARFFDSSIAEEANLADEQNTTMAATL